MSYQILTDSCCDFSPEQYHALQVTAVPLRLDFRGQISDDRNDARLKDFYDGLRAGEAARTSAVNPAQWAAAMEPLLARGEDLLVMTFSSGLSCTFQNARIAADTLKETYPHRQIEVADTRSASMGQGLLVSLARKKQEEGMSLSALVQWIEDTKPHLCHWFTVDDLMHLKRGGRISASTAVMGAMLQIKPVLHMDDDGHLVSVAKARGRKAALETLARKLQELGRSYDNSTVFLSHADCPEDAAWLKTLLTERYGVKEVVTGYVGTVIGSHAGPGTVALFFLGDHR